MTNRPGLRIRPMPPPDAERCQNRSVVQGASVRLGETTVRRCTRRTTEGDRYCRQHRAMRTKAPQ